MFSNVLYFVIVLFIFNMSEQEAPPEEPLYFSLLMILATWLSFVLYCRYSFAQLLRRREHGESDEGHLAAATQGLVGRCSGLAILLFAFDVHLFHLKYWLQAIPGFRSFSVLQGSVAILLFASHLLTLWYFSYPAYRLAFRVDITRQSHLLSHVRFNLPILFPWFILSLAHDILSLTPWGGGEGLLNRLEGQMLFLSVFLILITLFLPPLVQFWWGCKPLPPSERVRSLEGFLGERDFRYRHLLRWPIFEGRTMTAAIMGILPRYRYILVTDALMETLTTEELKAVLAHEMGHAKYKHMLFFVAFLLAFMPLFFGLVKITFYLLASLHFFLEILESGESQGIDLFYLVLSLPALATLFVYFRYGIGFFMRHFERQADLYSASIMGGPAHTISSLEKIAFLGGKTRDLPNWHHFSIRERVDVLWRVLSEPGLARRHSRFVALCIGVYLIFVLGLGYFLNYSHAKETLYYSLMGRMLHEQITRQPENVLLHQNLAFIYHQMGRQEEAMRMYEKIIRLDDTQALALNNLAWLLVTAPDEKMRDKERALVLAKKAVALKRSPEFLDTLAEAYYANGFTAEAISNIQEAIFIAGENRGYLERQLAKFQGAG